MATKSLRALAQHLDVPERTLRRAAMEGLLHGEREGPRRFRTSLREEAYLRANWPLLRGLRQALRTEPNVRFALLFGSVATGRSTDRSDIDLLVELANSAASRVAELTGRLEDRLERDVQAVRLEDAQRMPALMAAALDEGRVLVDRDGRWPSLAGSTARWRRRAEEAEPRSRTAYDRWTLMSEPPRASPPPPLEADDPARARDLKLKIGHRVSDVRRHLIALRTAMAEFGEDFELDLFAAAFASEEPTQLNHVQWIGRGFAAARVE